MRSAGASSGDKMIEDENQNKFGFVIKLCIGHEDADSVRKIIILNKFNNWHIGHLFERDLLSALAVFWRSGSVFVVDLGDIDVWLACLVVVWLVVVWLVVAWLVELVV